MDLAVPEEGRPPQTEGGRVPVVPEDDEVLVGVGRPGGSGVGPDPRRLSDVDVVASVGPTEAPEEGGSGGPQEGRQGPLFVEIASHVSVRLVVEEER